MRKGVPPVQGTVLVIWTELLKSFQLSWKDMMTTIVQMRKLRWREMKVCLLLTPDCVLEYPVKSKLQVHQQSNCSPSGAPTLTTTLPFPSDS